MWCNALKYQKYYTCHFYWYFLVSQESDIWYWTTFIIRYFTFTKVLPQHLHFYSGLTCVFYNSAVPHVETVRVKLFTDQSEPQNWFRAVGQSSCFGTVDPQTPEDRKRCFANNPAVSNIFLPTCSPSLNPTERCMAESPPSMFTSSRPWRRLV